MTDEPVFAQVPPPQKFNDPVIIYLTEEELKGWYQYIEAAPDPEETP